MLLVNTNEIPGKEIKEVIGLVRGSTIQSKHIGKDFMAGLKTIVGGEISEYTEMLENARQVALGRMIKDAENQGADAIVNIRFATSAIMQGAAELLVYGTAVKVE
ncbi:heavy metal-binding domain-containing protein [Acidaminobacter sp. JC074]|uniref:YbjQ family protein n=1 Tax=Acidaminobacter sp. JC074 TaxID=2530199 RepID=UPI001F0E99F6|nr:heavy metal-binding domain-containing protein [Acidaminobacter sp. JC074]MCH4890563.1 heavy metal-binding domain-containing protein [Acidaminobacter sp. JC074]